MPFVGVDLVDELDFDMLVFTREKCAKTLSELSRPLVDDPHRYLRMNQRVRAHQPRRTGTYDEYVDLALFHAARFAREKSVVEASEPLSAPRMLNTGPVPRHARNLGGGHTTAPILAPRQGRFRQRHTLWREVPGARELYGAAQKKPVMDRGGNPI